MVAPAVAAAAITAGASIFSGITGGKGASKAAKTAAASAAQDRALAQSIYNTNVGLAQPTVDRGNAAGAQLNALLGLGGNVQGAQDALATFRNATGYQDSLAEGQRAINTGYAARGVLESGAAQKALAKYSAQQAQGSFGQYMNALTNQQGAGLNALGSVTGSGSNYVAQSMQANQAGASAQANAQLYGSQAWQGALAGVAGAAANLYGQSSYGAQPNALPTGFGTPGYGAMTNQYGMIQQQPFNYFGGRSPWGN